MKLFEVSGSYHKNIKSWVTRAKSLTITHVKELLQKESQQDPKWFVNQRGSKLNQLISEILTLKLEEVSNESWSETDFVGAEHSSLITSTIKEISTVVEPEYRRLRVEIISAELPQTPATPTQTKPNVESKTV